MTVATSLGRIAAVRWVGRQRARRRRWEVQQVDAHGHLCWYSNAPYLSRRKAVRVARRRRTPRGHTLVVKHVGTGETAYWVAQL